MFRMWTHPLHKRKAPVENFLETVLVSQTNVVEHSWDDYWDTLEQEATMPYPSVSQPFQLRGPDTFWKNWVVHSYVKATKAMLWNACTYRHCSKVADLFLYAIQCHSCCERQPVYSLAAVIRCPDNCITLYICPNYVAHLKHALWLTGGDSLAWQSERQVTYSAKS